jgi:ATP-binding cassette subfamily G (WHITE) protein 2 (PDR)
MGTVTGEMFVDGQNCGKSFQRQTGYVQQQDVHLATSTVREALNFSALLRQPRESPEAEKLAYVDEMIELLGMEDIAEAVIGTPGENGLNIEQRKRLTIGIELAAKPQLLIFFDEPTSGLDSQTAWSICDLLRKLTSKGQAVLCTIHQPSSMLFQQFDRLLLLAKGGKTVYVGGKLSSSFLCIPCNHLLTAFRDRRGLLHTHRLFRKEWCPKMSARCKSRRMGGRSHWHNL